MKLTWRTCLKIGVTVFLLYLCIEYWALVANAVATGLRAALPLFVGCGIAYPVNTLMAFYERHFSPEVKEGPIARTRRPICMAAAFFTLVLIIVVVARLVIPELVSCVKIIFAALPNALDSIVDLLTESSVLPANLSAALEATNWQARLEQAIDLLTSGASTLMLSLVDAASSVLSGIVTALLGLIFSIYLLYNKETLTGQVKRLMGHYLPAAWNENILYVLRVFNECMTRYVVGQCVEAVILGTLCATGMIVLGLPYASMIGALIAFTALIPIAGAYIGGIVGALMIFSVDPGQALVFLVFLIVLQQVEGNLIYPKVVGTSIGLPAIWVLAAVTIGGGLMGVLGMLLGVPVAASLYRLLKNDLNGRRTIQG